TGRELTWRPTGARPAAGAPQPQPAPVPRGVAPQQPRQPDPARQPSRPLAASVPAPTAARRYRQTIHRVDLWSVLKVSVCFYICGMAVTLVAMVALWVIADAAGVIHSVESFFGDLLQTKDFTFLSGEILRGTLLVGGVIVILQIVITVIAAAFYNVFAELFGGVEITISEDETGF
ncbi:MAG TPA: DUF3566 domain-containing protein, partial [Acidimicrobiia bacterium]